MSDPQHDDLLERIHDLERANHRWKRVALGAIAALALVLLLAGGLTLVLFLQAAAERDRAVQARQQELRARDEAEVARLEAVRQRDAAVQQARAAREAAAKVPRKDAP